MTESVGELAKPEPENGNLDRRNAIAFVVLLVMQLYFHRGLKPYLWDLESIRDPGRWN